MKFNNKKVTGITSNILYNDHFINDSYDCSNLKDKVNEDGIIQAGTIIPANDATAVGVLFSDVDFDGNPNGTILIHGFVDTAKIPEQPSDEAKQALGLVKFM